MELALARGPQHLTNNSNGGTNMLSELELRDISRSVTPFVSNLQNGNDDHHTFGRAQQLLQRLLDTASSTHLSPSHGAAAIGALCGLLEACSAAISSSVRYIALEQAVWIKARDIYLYRSHNNKDKPLRRLLLTLANLLNRQPYENDRMELTSSTISKCVKAICEEDDAVSIKPTILLMEHFLRQQLVTVSSIVINASQYRSISSSPSLASLPIRSDNNDETQLLSEAHAFTQDILQWVRYPDCAPVISRFLPLYYQALKTFLASKTELGNSKQAISSLLWVTPLRVFLKANPTMLESLENYVFPPLLRLDKGDTQAFIQILRIGYWGPHTDTDIQLCLLTARTELKLGSRNVFSADPDEHDTGAHLDPNALSLDFLDHASPSIRLSALNTLLVAITLSGTLSHQMFERFKECLPYFHQETNSKSRNEFIAVVKKLINRLARQKMIIVDASSCHSEAVAEQSRVHEEVSIDRSALFLDWYTEFLVQELRPTTSYQGHLTALKVLYHLHDIELQSLRPLGKTQSRLKSRVLCSSFHARAIGPLLKLMSDPYEDVRHTSNAIIDIVVKVELSPRGTSPEIGEQSLIQIPIPRSMSAISSILEAIPKAEILFRKSGRADHADGLARLQCLALYARKFSTTWYGQYATYKMIEYDLGQDIETAAKNLGHAVDTAPLHGHLIALRYVIDRSYSEYSPRLKNLITSLAFGEKMLDLCQRIWRFVRTILCADAPEGQILNGDDTDDVEMDGKERLSFCWRALKESSLLMNAIISEYVARPKEWGAGPYHLTHYQLGSLAFQQLAELRHRGAFSTVSQTFSAWCVSCKKSSNAETHDWPKKFYEQTLLCVQQRANALTRRSAGLPTMVTGILSAYPSGSFFDDVLLDLQAIADAPIGDSNAYDEVQLPQVHALNCLKEVFTDSRFAHSTEEHIANSLDLAAGCLDSAVWAIRNCGLMLMKALLNRINGGTDILARASSLHRRFSKLTYEKYPNLASLILTLLCNPSPASQHGDISVSHVQRVFPALEMVERFGMPANGSQLISKAISKHLEGPIWSLREKAAKALSSHVHHDKIEDELNRLLSTDYLSQNALHGRLLCVRWLLRRSGGFLRHDAASKATAVSSILSARFNDMIVSNKCPFTAAAFLDIVGDFIESAPKIGYTLAHHSRSYPIIFDPATESQNSSDYSLIRASLERYRCLVLMDSVSRGGREPLPPHDHGLGSFPEHMDDHECCLRRTGVQVGILFVQRRTEKDTRIRLTCRDVSGFISSVENILKSNADPEIHISWIRSLVLIITAETIIDLASQHKNVPHELPTRLAAVLSIQDFLTFVLEGGAQHYRTPELIPVYLLLHDAMNDDDEEVRDVAARTASLLFRNIKHAEVSNNHSLSVPATRARLIGFLTRSFGSSKRLWGEACLRSSGYLDRAVTSSRFPYTDHNDNAISKYYDDTLSMRSLLCKSLDTKREQHVIFEQEKSNLYIDPVRESETWISVLTSIRPKYPTADVGLSSDYTW